LKANTYNFYKKNTNKTILDKFSIIREMQQQGLGQFRLQANKCNCETHHPDCNSIQVYKSANTQ